MLLFQLFIVAISILLISIPSSACACIGDGQVGLLVKILLFLASIFVFPIALLAINSSKASPKKRILLYIPICAASFSAWFIHEYLILLFPLLPFIFMVLWLKKGRA